MNNKKNNKYKILLQEIELKDGSQSGKSISFEIENHDNILRLVEQAQTSDRFEDKSQNTGFILGLKLLGEVMLNNKSNPLFEVFFPPFVEFMKKVKGKKPGTFNPD